MSIPDKIVTELMGRPWRDEQTGSEASQALDSGSSQSAGSVASVEPHPKRGYYGNHYSENEVFPIWDEDGNAIELA